MSNETAAEIQALCSVAVVIITGVLAGITWWYVRLTSTLSRTAQDQFSLGQRQFELSRESLVSAVEAAKLQKRTFLLANAPRLQMSIQIKVASPEELRLSWGVRNVGKDSSSDLRIHSIEVRYQTFEGSKVEEAPHFFGSVLAAGQDIAQDAPIFHKEWVSWHPAVIAGLCIIVVQCSDMMGYVQYH